MDQQRVHEPEPEHEPETSGGSVSEVANLGDGAPIEPDQAVGGATDDAVQEGKQGPNARTGNRAPGN